MNCLILTINKMATLTKNEANDVNRTKYALLDQFPKATYISDWLISFQILKGIWTASTVWPKTTRSSSSRSQNLMWPK